MDKYIAFNLYRKNEQGAHQPALRDDVAKDVYLAADVDACIAELEGLLRRSYDLLGYGLSTSAIELRDEISKSLMER